MRTSVQWLRGRFVEVWWILRHDSTAFTEAISGLTLLVLRGLLLVLAPRGVLPLDVQFRLYPISEKTWAAYIVVLGILQVLFAPSGRLRGVRRHTTIRLWIKILILLGFTTVATAYWLEGLVFSGGMLSFVSMTGFYFALFLRIMRERKMPPNAAERSDHAHAH